MVKIGEKRVTIVATPLQMYRSSDIVRGVASMSLLRYHATTLHLYIIYIVYYLLSKK